ncbi:MAG TPA: uracil phosphoribosyltransferase [Flavobacteriaceae bacterium]|nr:uracil phosphoribosyltransferase [Flavobacteriaceae bacterium]HIP27322.1 uracil phosphoribosyltransferase [Flavobacteriaceae bacterium]
MIGLNIFRATGELINKSFFIYDYFRELNNAENWWVSNLFNIILFLIGAFLFTYWYGQLIKFSKNGTEDFS